MYPFLFRFFMPPTLKKLEGHIAFGLCVCLSVCHFEDFPSNFDKITPF